MIPQVHDSGTQFYIETQDAYSWNNPFSPDLSDVRHSIFMVHNKEVELNQNRVAKVEIVPNEYKEIIHPPPFH